MGKIGDLIVRLQLKHEDYKKGLKQAEKDTQGFAGTLGKIKGVGLAVWGAIGGAVLKVASDMVKSTNAMEDKWEMFTSKAKAGWNAFVKTLVNGDWNNFVRNFKEATIAAEYLTSALQDTTEVENSIKLQKAAMAEELAALEVLMRDQTKSYKDRADAAQQYIDKVSPIYDQEIKRLEDLKKAYMVTLGAGKYSPETMTSPAVMAAVEKFLVEYGKDTKQPLLRNKTLKEAIDNALIPYDVAPKGKEAVEGQRKRTAAMEQLQWLTQEWFPGFDPNFLYHIAKNYEQNMNGEQVQALVEAITAYSTALGAKDTELKKVYGILNSTTSKIEGSEGAETEVATAEAISTLALGLDKLGGIQAPALQMNLPDIIPDDWLERNREKIDAALAEAMRLQQITNEINSQFNDAVVASLSGATQALADCIMGIEGADASQVLAALLQPFAQTMISLGEILLAEGTAIEVFKTSLSSLNGAAAIGAGIGLIALGSALAAGIKALGGASSSSASAGGYDSASSSGSRGIETYEQEITVHVVGEIAGDKIVLAGQKTLNKWNR